MALVVDYYGYYISFVRAKNRFVENPFTPRGEGGRALAAAWESGRTQTIHRMERFTSRLPFC